MPLTNCETGEAETILNGWRGRLADFRKKIENKEEENPASQSKALNS
jgi:hypothetical protein